MRIAGLLVSIAALFAAEPARIVSTAPSLTEILFALGVGNRVVGVSNYCHYPPEAASRTKVGSYLRPNLESIVALRPDLVFVNRIPGDPASRLRQLGLKVMEVDPHGIEGILNAVQEIGAATGNTRAASRLREEVKEQLNRVRQEAAKLPRKRVAFIVGRTPNRIEGLIAVGRESYLGEVLSVSGGDNVFANAPVMYPKISLEEMIGRDPDVIIDMGDMAETTGVTQEHKQHIVDLWSQYTVLTAVRKHQVCAVASDIFVVPGPRVVQAAREFFRLIHPEAKR